MNTNKHCCYILKNDKDNCTYVGYTNDPTKRIRRHNGELAGGARFTTNRKKRTGCIWTFMTLIEPVNFDFTKNMALSLEWHIKHKKKCTRNEAALSLLADKFRENQFIVYTVLEDMSMFLDKPNIEVRDIERLIV